LGALESPSLQRLAGASFLVLANKQDLEGAMTDGEIREVFATLFLLILFSLILQYFEGSGSLADKDA
jgi:hypothetical protein